MNKQKGNMYDWITHTWNPIRGECPHICKYCYMHGRFGGPLRLDPKEFKTDLGEGNVIFVGSSTDMWAEAVPSDWITQVLAHCNKYPQNTYIFQSKNPKRFQGEFPSYDCFPWNTLLGTTIETNRQNDISKAPPVRARALALGNAPAFRKRFVTIEPIMDFDLNSMVEIILGARPDKVFIGADSKGHHLPEPSYAKMMGLEAMLVYHKIEVIEKPNLKRLKKGG